MIPPAMKPSEIFDLTGQIAVVIGATGALGGAIAEGLAEAGAAVAVVGRNRERGLARAQAITSKGGKSLFAQADAARRDNLRSAHETIRRDLGPVGILVNAAGGNDAKVTVTDASPFENISLPDWQANYELNVIGGALLPCQEFGPAMIERGRGSIINIASVTAHLPLSRVVSYSSAKAAVLNLTLFLAREWAQKGVRVNSITPGFFPAEQNRKLLFQEDGAPTARTKSILSHTPMNRFGESHELIGAALFLASHKASSFVTGADLRVDGGFLSQTI
ncbi:MAG TPA: SDR family NAD(P)-dependent oxidoreductase [Verrucomicrobiae bacterium]|nr:SDR family NAD(P)-dependent oxidoreductase [Verrucomicrobiae bacterium]